MPASTAVLNMPGADCILFGPDQLLPESWKALAREGPVRTFNPGLLREGTGWIFAYRIVASDGLRRIGICRLNASLHVIEGSPLPLTDRVCFRTGNGYPELSTRWFADPRLYRFGQRLYIYWNSGWHEPRNCQFLQELDPVTLLPRGFPRELVLHGPRQKLEKNWTFFPDDHGQPCAVYSITPHRVLQFSFDGEDEIVFEEISRIEWALRDYPASHGGLRGGAPPCLAEGEFWSFCHSVHDGADGYRYAPAAYSFAAKSPFAPLRGPARPLALGNSSGATRIYERLNAAVGEVIYPCGAQRDGARWMISHGINDEVCAISIVPHSTVLETLQPSHAPI